MFARLRQYLLLPKEITQFEDDYLRRMNRIAFSVLWLHLPVLMLCAALCGTGVVFCFGITTFALVGVSLAYVTLKNPRHVSITFGFCAMCLGGLLVHFGQGPMQIEMHFYFFTVVALLSVFGNPMVIVVAAVTVAAHHLLLFFLLPRSVFNYDASIWAVLVHALFVVVESVAACFVSRSFFNDVIGLELIVCQRTAEVDASNRAMRLVLDHMNQGLVMLDRDAVPIGERSRAIELFLGQLPAGRPIWEGFEGHDRHFAQMLMLGWDALLADVLPLPLLLDQLPKRLSIRGRHLEIEYTPIFVDHTFAQLLLVLTDVTSEVEKAFFEAEQREMVAAIEKLLNNKDAFVDFFGEASSLVSRVTSVNRAPLPDLRRLVHTLKGTSSIFGLTSIAAYCHEIEDRLEEGGAELDAADRDELASRWRRLSGKFEKLLGVGLRRIEISPSEHAELLDELLTGAPRHQIARKVASWKLQPTLSRLTQFADQIHDLTQRLGKGEVRVEVCANDLRISPEHWAGFFGAFSHVVRNAVDHGLETEEERVAQGKPERGHLRLSTALSGGHFIVEIADDGRGIDWERVADKARQRGLPHDTREALIDALFSDGISTKEVVTEISGRGVGLGAARQACTQMGGFVKVSSEHGVGTTFQFIFPAERMVGDELQMLPARTSPPKSVGVPTDEALLSAPGGELHWQTLAPLLQGACCELFLSYGAALRGDPYAPDPAEVSDEVAALIGFSGENLNGNLTILAEIGLLRKIGALESDQDEWIAELANQLLGRLKNKLLPLGLLIYPSTPVCLKVKNPELAQARRALRRCALVGDDGRACVWMEGAIASGYTPPMIPLIAAEAPLLEGEMLMF